MKAKAETETHRLILVRIEKMVGDFNRQRYAATQELAAIFAASAAGMPEAQPATERAEAVRNRTLELINGHAPDHLKLPPATPRQETLEIEVAALDEALHALSQRENVVRGAAAEMHVSQRRDEWIGICADIIITATRLQALERRAVEWRSNLAGVVPATLPLATFVGTGRSILNIPWGADPLSRPREAALQANIVTEKEIKAAQNA